MNFNIFSVRLADWNHWRVEFADGYVIIMARATGKVVLGYPITCSKSGIPGQWR